VLLADEKTKQSDDTVPTTKGKSYIKQTILFGFESIIGDYDKEKMKKIRLK
jgi:hypothetical protein